jgi:hypothetical protein
MYSGTAVVMSREFRSASDVWNVLSFKEGVRGRGQFSVEGVPEGIAMSDASTRIKVRVDESFLYSLAYTERHLSEEFVSRKMATLETFISFRLMQLLLPLDVCVHGQFFGKPSVPLNDPLFYEKDREIVFAKLCELMPKREEDDDSFSEHQGLMFMPMHEGHDGEIYGYGALNISGFIGAIKAVGGLVHEIPEHYDRDPILGVLEYDVTAATRTPDKLAVPAEILKLWIQDQIELVLTLGLTDQERYEAVKSLAYWKSDIRPLFFVETSDGGLDRQQFMEKLSEVGHVVFPAERYMHRGREIADLSLPRIGEVFLKTDDIDFKTFANNRGKYVMVCFAI